MLVFSFAFVKEGAAGARSRGGHPVDRDRLLRHAGARTHVRARALRRNDAGAAARAGAAAGDLRRQAAGHRAACSSSPKLLLVPMVALLFQAPLFSRPLLLLGAARCRGPSDSASVGTLFAAMLIRARTRDVHAADPVVSDHRSGHHCGRARHRRRCYSRRRTSRWRRCGLRLLACFDVVFVTLALWMFEPLMTE